MRVARYYNNRSVRVETMQEPTIAEGEVLVRVMACGICGSDVMEWFRVPKSPRILGHEIAGVVTATRSQRFALGERVVVRNQVPCQACRPCTLGHQSVCESMVEIVPGGMAEYIRLPREVVHSGVFKLPAALSFAAGALVEPVACTIHSQELARVDERHSMVVIGCGVAGLLHIQLAKARGLRQIVAIESVEYRALAAARSGATLTLHPAQDLVSEVRKVTDGRGADVIVVACGAPNAIETARNLVNRHGVILLFGVPNPEASFPCNANRLFWRNELTLVSNYGAGNVAFSRGIELIERGAIDAAMLITDNVPLASVQDGFDLVARAQQSLKVVLAVAQS